MPPFADHYGFGSESDNSTVYKHFKGSIFGMFRDPSRRAVSDYFRAYLNYHRDHPSSSAETDPHNPPSGVQSLLEHSQTNAGLAVRMLAAPEADRCKSAIARSGATCAPLDNRTLALARRRLKEGFAFIGDTDECASPPPSPTPTHHVILQPRPLRDQKGRCSSENSHGDVPSMVGACWWHAWSPR